MGISPGAPERLRRGLSSRQALCQQLVAVWTHHLVERDQDLLASFFAGVASVAGIAGRKLTTVTVAAQSRCHD